jgi:CheY-like chemotaxis protein
MQQCLPNDGSGKTGRKMASKLALIVDDSKSARFVLRRMLEDLKLEVDTVESATEAIDYLKHHHPNVIFMDHMMPGMDGFEAVKRIKSDSLTAVIPIMMYTSKGGDVYLSQARALGAVGIIPKTISPVDLKESLLKLRLIDGAPAKTRGKTKAKKAVKAKVENKNAKNKNESKELEEALIKKDDVLDTYINDLHRMMDDQTVELHKSMWLGIESVGHELFNRLNSQLDERLDKIQSTTQEFTPEYLPENKSKASWPIYLVVLLILSIIINVVLFSRVNNLKNALATTEDTTGKIAGEQQFDFFGGNEIEDSLPSKKASTEQFLKWAQSKVVLYPHNELALNYTRLSEVKALIKRAVEVEFTGSIILQTHVGIFCLNSDQQGNYNLADETMPVTDCDHIGNPVQPNDLPSTHQSLGFANYLTDLDFLSEEGIVIEVTSVPRKIELSKYPKRNSKTNAEKWNQAAKQNNSVTVKLVPTKYN